MIQPLWDDSVLYVIWHGGQIDVFLDLDDLRSELKPFYSFIGRPSIDPALMIGMLIVGYCFGIRSERRLCDEVHLNLAYRWFCRLGLDGKVPDHSTFSLNRNGRFRESNILRHLFESVVHRCMDEGLVGGDGFSVDASLIQADANKQCSIAGREWKAESIPADAPQAVRDYLATLDDTAFGAASNTCPKFISPSDPAAQWTGAHKDRKNQGPFRTSPQAIGRRHSLWVRFDAGMAGEREENRATCSCIRQITTH